MRDLRSLLSEARAEILRLRRENELLHAKVDGFELAGRLVFSTPSMPNNVGASPDVAWFLQQTIDSLPEPVTKGVAE